MKALPKYLFTFGEAARLTGMTAERVEQLVSVGAVLTVKKRTGFGVRSRRNGRRMVPRSELKHLAAFAPGCFDCTMNRCIAADLDVEVRPCRGHRREQRKAA